MRQPIRPLTIIALVFAAQLCGSAAGAELSAQETRWLQAAAPVLAYAQQLHMPIDIVVQPQAGPNDVPMAMGFDARRCKLVLSLRGNSDAEAILADIDPAQRSLMIEVMAAHELGHCWRYTQGRWHALPAGFVERDGGDGDGGSGGGSAARAEALRQLREMRREEAYSDLAALAWTAQRHPGQYQAVLGWLRTVRAGEAVAGGGHDTAAWLDLAHGGLPVAADGNPFEAVGAAWQAGLLLEKSASTPAGLHD